MTTLAAFLPMLLWPGVAGQFMKYLPLTVIIVLSASLLTAMVFLPVVGSLIGKCDPETRRCSSVSARTRPWTTPGSAASWGSISASWDERSATRCWSSWRWGDWSAASSIPTQRIRPARSSSSRPSPSRQWSMCAAAAISPTRKSSPWCARWKNRHLGQRHRQRLHLCRHRYHRRRGARRQSRYPGRCHRPDPA